MLAAMLQPAPGNIVIQILRIMRKLPTSTCVLLVYSPFYTVRAVECVLALTLPSAKDPRHPS